jgi:hypothetical protein
MEKRCPSCGVINPERASSCANCRRDLVVPPADVEPRSHGCLGAFLGGLLGFVLGIAYGAISIRGVESAGMEYIVFLYYPPIGAVIGACLGGVLGGVLVSRKSSRPG